jgi:tRNA(Arg) A34 adenosine deaminase TadA
VVRHRPGAGILTAFLISFFPITVNIATGLATLEPELEDVLRVLGAKRWDVLVKVGLPRSMPYFYGSLKVAITLAFVGTTVLAEMTAGNEGIGYLLQTAGGQQRMGLAFAGLVTIGAMAMAMYELFSWVEKRTTAGRTAARRTTRPRDDMTPEQAARHLRRANEVARRAMSLGRHPFGAILVAPDGETVLAEQGNVDTVNHAESVLARTAVQNYSADYLWQCTLVTTVEPCAMCAGTQYWAHIGRLVYGMTESRLLELTGNHGENPTMDLPCREVFARGQKAIEVTGPVAEVEEDIATLHRGFWK